MEEMPTHPESTGRPWGSIQRGGFFDRHPILIPALAFSLCWIPYVLVFFRKSIAFGSLGGPVGLGSALYWALFAVQLGVCVISHSLTIRTIVRLYAPRWLIFGSVLFFCLSPLWGLLTAADIRHPLFAAVFCVFVSSLVFALYGRRRTPWLWVQLGAGALCVCLLREGGPWSVLPTLAALVAFLVWEEGGRREGGAKGQGRLRFLAPSTAKRREARWSDVFAAFLTLSAVGLLFAFAVGMGQELPLGQPDFGAVAAAGPGAGDPREGGGAPESGGWGANLTGTEDVAGVLPLSEIERNSLWAALAVPAARLFLVQQCLPAVNLTFSWAAFTLLFLGFCAAAIVRSVRLGDVRPLIVALPMAAILILMAAVPADATTRYMLPILAAQPMFFAATLWRPPR